MSTAQREAESWGVPAETFWAICEYLESLPVGTKGATSPETRYAPATRASALRACRFLFTIKHEET